MTKQQINQQKKQSKSQMNINLDMKYNNLWIKGTCM